MKEIVAVMKISFPGINPEISEWKGQEISDFQEEMLKKVNSRLSEKWFYTHIKSSNQSLPRIDVLNMLSLYAGYLNWDDFRYKNSDTLPEFDIIRKNDPVLKRIPVIVLTILILLYIIYKVINTQNYKINFIDADTGDQIISNKIQVDLLSDGESPLTYISDDSGNIGIRTDKSLIKMAIRAPYYLPDTINRILKKFNRSEHIRLKIDSYAMMIKYFSQTDVEGWRNRRDQLNNIFSDEAMIFQLPDDAGGSGMELFNKQEFIDKLTMPSTSLNKMEILYSKYDRGQIVILKFKLNVIKE